MDEREYFAKLKAMEADLAPPWELDRAGRERRLAIRSIQQDMTALLLEREPNLDLDDYEFKFIKCLKRLLRRKPSRPILSPRQEAFLKKTFKRYFKHSDLLAEYEDIGFLADPEDFCDLERDDDEAEAEAASQQDDDDDED